MNYIVRVSRGGGPWVDHNRSIRFEDFEEAGAVRDRLQQEPGVAAKVCDFYTQEEVTE